MTDEPLLPLIAEPDALEAVPDDARLLVVQITKPEKYAEYHVPGAVLVEGFRFVRVEKPVMGLLPSAADLSRLFTSIGMTPDTHVVACDDEGGGWASRFLWTLDVAGHRRFSLLNGGLVAWANEGHALEREPVTPAAGDYRLERLRDEPVADAAYILSRLGAADFALWDARTPQEYTGAKKFAARGGHIPGAVNLNWLETMDPDRHLRLKPEDELRALLERHGLTPDKEIVCYCQSHHRSSHSYVLLKALGYPRVKGYPGAWSEWGNRPDTPVEQ